jgi:hypothetical protein
VFFTGRTKLSVSLPLSLTQSSGAGSFLPLLHTAWLILPIEYYQLEEMEDKDTCTTELFLRADGGIEFGDTDGPKVRSLTNVNDTCFKALLSSTFATSFSTFMQKGHGAYRKVQMIIQ